MRINFVTKYGIVYAMTGLLIRDIYLYRTLDFNNFLEAISDHMMIIGGVAAFVSFIFDFVIFLTKK